MTFHSLPESREMNSICGMEATEKRKKNHLNNKLCVVQHIIQTEMKESCLQISLMNDAPFPLCVRKTISPWEKSEENILKFIPIKCADVFYVRNQGNEKIFSLYLSILGPFMLYIKDSQ